MSLPLGKHGDEGRLAFQSSEVESEVDEEGSKMLGSILLVFGIMVLVGAFGTGSVSVGIVGVIMIIGGALLFWRTSATRAYLNNNKRR